MYIQLRLRPALAMATVVTFAATLAASDYEGSFEKTLSVNGQLVMDVSTGSGYIDVRTGESSRVRVRGTIRVSRSLSSHAARKRIQEIEQDPPIEQTGNLIRIGLPKGVRRYINIGDAWRHVSISYELIVPVDTRLKSDTGSGHQVITGLKGPVKVTTGSGEIEITSVSGTVSATTGSGNIRASGASGTIRAHTGSGDLTLEQSSLGSADVQTGSGDVEIHGVAGPVRAHTGSGSITAAGNPTGDWILETGTGNVNLRLSAQAGFTLNAHTGSGSIESDHPVTVQGKVGRSHLRGTVRGGGSLVDVGTGSGNIRID